MKKTIYMVELKTSRTPIFPDSCVFCGKAGSEAIVNMKLNTYQGYSSGYYYFYPLVSKKRLRVNPPPLLNIPVHDTCARKYRNNFLKHLVLIVIIALSIIAMSNYIIHNTLIGLIFAVLVCSPLFYLLVSKPIPVNYGKPSGKYTITFRDRNYAESFAHLNNAEVREYR